jgi:hypothetical protein
MKLTLRVGLAGEAHNKRLERTGYVKETYQEIEQVRQAPRLVEDFQTRLLESFHRLPCRINYEDYIPIPRSDICRIAMNSGRSK